MSGLCIRTIFLAAFILFFCSLQHASADTKKFDVEYDEGAPSYGDLPLHDIKPVRVSVSSTLASKNGAYEAKHAADGKPGTAWCKGTAGNGVGEWLLFEFSKPVPVTVLSFVPFFAKSDATLANNNRIKKLKIEMDGGVSGIVEFTDAKWCKDCQLQYPAPLVNFYKEGRTKFIKTKSIKFTILDVYPGRTYNDTCISDIEVKIWGGK